MKGPLRKKPRREDEKTSRGPHSDSHDKDDGIRMDGIVSSTASRETRKEEEVEGVESQDDVKCTFDESSASDAEDRLLAEGEKLSGAALRDFLQHNFTDFVERKLPCIAELEEMDM